MGEVDPTLRAFRDDVLTRLGDPGLALVDVRSPAEFNGEVIAPPGMSETAQRAGRIPGATSAPWAQTVNEDGTFKDADALAAHYAGKGVTPDKDVIAYCRIGERSSHSWFVLHELLGYQQRQELRRLVDRVRLAHQRAHREGCARLTVVSAHGLGRYPNRPGRCRRLVRSRVLRGPASSWRQSVRHRGRQAPASCRSTIAILPLTICRRAGSLRVPTWSPGRTASLAARPGRGAPSGGPAPVDGGQDLHGAAELPVHWLLSSTNTRPRSGSTHSRVPLAPACVNDRGDAGRRTPWTSNSCGCPIAPRWRPGYASRARSRRCARSRPRAAPGCPAVCSRVISSMAACDRIRTPSAGPRVARQQRPPESQQVLGRAEQPAAGQGGRREESDHELACHEVVHAHAVHLLDAWPLGSRVERGVDHAQGRHHALSQRDRKGHPGERRDGRREQVEGIGRVRVPAARLERGHLAPDPV